MAVFAVAASTALGVFDTEISEWVKNVNVSESDLKEMLSDHTLICTGLNVDLVISRSIVRDELD